MKNTRTTPNQSCSPKDPCSFLGMTDENGNVAYGCVPGEPDCSSFIMIEAEISEFHDHNLNKATKKIKKIIADIPPDPSGRKLSLISTANGFLLAWVKHGLVVPEGAKVMTQQSVGAEAFLKELKIKA